jgi:putative ABC transport system ATP-binding protein
MTKDQLAEVRNRKIGFVFQGFNLRAQPPSITSSRRRSTAARRRRRNATTGHGRLSEVGLPRAGHHSNQLSGGQQQRVAIARALVNNPSILLADEPTGNLDSKTGVEIMGVFQRLHDAGNTIILVTHEPDIAEYATRVLSFRDGHIVSDQTVKRRRLADDELKTLPEEATA